jgi:hypothetical protein
MFFIMIICVITSYEPKFDATERATRHFRPLQNRGENFTPLPKIVVTKFAGKGELGGLRSLHFPSRNFPPSATSEAVIAVFN